MQQTGIETLQHVASSLGGLGRYGDTYMIHAAEGETVIPMEILDRDPLLKERLFDSMRAMGVDPERYIVGNELNSLNPLTGQPEFFFKTIKKLLKSPIAQAAASFFIPGGYSWLAAPAMEALGGGDTKDIFHAALRGGAGQLTGDYLGGEGMWDTGGKFAGKGSPDWWTNLKSGLWKSPAKMDTATLKTKLTEADEIAKMMNLTEGSEAYGTHMTNAYNKYMAGLSEQGILQKMGSSIIEDPLKALFVGGMGYGQYAEAKAYNEALKQQQEEGDSYQYDVNYDVIDDVLGTTTPIFNPPAVTPVAQGGIMKAFPRKQGGISGPGSGTSDDIPAMLSDGEFVMTANAVKGAGGGSRSAGTKKMYDMMRQFEGRA
mgnify:CR=1 FL=1|tara:strand:+ start:1773 stop:2891 length:1119 start_codon:yes stop_codon:yes gene_type:complete